MIQKFLKKIHILQYLHKFFLVYKEYICMYFVFINFGKIKKYLNKQKESFLTIRNYVAKSKEGHFRKIVFVIDGKLQMIQAHIEEQPEVTVTYFHPDKKKSGGAYVTVTGSAKKVDNVSKLLLLQDGRAIPIKDIHSFRI